MKKKNIYFILLITLFLASRVSFGHEGIQAMEAHPFKLYVNGSPYTRLEEVYIENDRAYIRSDILDKELDLKSNPILGNRVQLTGKNFDLILPTDKPGGVYNGKFLSSKHQAKIREGFIYYPLRLVMESAKVPLEWDERNRVIVAKTKDQYRKKEGKILFDSGEFALYGKDKPGPPFAFLDRGKEIGIYSRKQKGKESKPLARIRIDRQAKLESGQGQLLAWKEGYYYEFYWGPEARKKANREEKKALEDLLQTFRLYK